MSKVVIYRVPDAEEAADFDVEYTFIQVDIKSGDLDMTGNCGNLTSAVGPVAVRTREFQRVADRLVATDEEFQAEAGPRIANLRLKNLNTNKIIHASFPVIRKLGGVPRWLYDAQGDYSIDGVPGTASKIDLQWQDPGGSKTGHVLPTGNTIDLLNIGSESIQASLVDVSNPGIFVDGRALSWSFQRTPEELNQNTELMARLEAFRKKGAEMMGLPQDKPSIPKIVLVYPPATDNTMIDCQAISMEQAHKAVPGTLALNLAATSKIPGTIPQRLFRGMLEDQVIIGHPSGKAEIIANVNNREVSGVGFSRTARSLMEGFVNYEAPMSKRAFLRKEILRQNVGTASGILKPRGSSRKNVKR